MVSIALYVSSRNWIVRAGTTVVVGAGVLVFVGWLLNIAVLKSVLPGWATMKVNTACGFIASGAALWLLHASPPGSGRAWLARALAVLVTALGVLTLAEAILGTDLGIDRLLLPVNGRATMVSQPGRMSPAAAFNLMMIGSSLLVLNARKPGSRPPPMACHPAFVGIDACFPGLCLRRELALRDKTLYDHSDTHRVSFLNPHIFSSCS